MDGGDKSHPSAAVPNMTEGTAVLASNGEAGNKGKKIEKSRSPRRFGRKSKSAERDMGRSPSPTRPASPSDTGDHVATSSPNSSRSNSQKKSKGRLFHRSSPSVKRSRSLSASRRHKHRSKSSDGSKTDSLIVDSDVERSYRTFDPHRKPRGRLRKMTVQEAREEQKQRLLDSVTHLPSYASITDPGNSSTLGLFRARSGTSSSLPDITKCLQTGEEQTEGHNSDKSPDTNQCSTPSPSPKHLGRPGHLEEPNAVSNKGGKSPNSKRKGKGHRKFGRRSPETKCKTGNNNHSDKDSASNKKSHQDINEDNIKSQHGSKSSEHGNKKGGGKKSFGLNGRNSKQKAVAHQKDIVPKKFQNQSEKVMVGVADDEVRERRRQSLAKFLALSKMSSLDSSSSDRGDDRDRPVSPSSPGLPSPSRSEPSTSGWGHILPNSPTEKYTSPRLFGRSVSSHAAPQGRTDGSGPQTEPGSGRPKRSHSEGTERGRRGGKSSGVRRNTSSPGESKSGKYKRTFSPTRKQNEEEVLGGDSSTNKPDTPGNEIITANAEGDELPSNSPVGRINCSADKSSLSSPNVATLKCETSGVELAADSVNPQNDCCETTSLISEQNETPNRDQIKCEVVIEAPGNNNSEETDQAKLEGSGFRRAPKHCSNRLSPDPCLSQSEDEEQFFDASDSPGEEGERQRTPNRLTPTPDPSCQHRGSLVTDDIPYIEAAPDNVETEKLDIPLSIEEEKKSNKLSFRALVLVKRLSRRSKSVRAKKKSPSPRSSLPDVRIEDYDNQTNQEKDSEKEFVVIENESGKTDNLEPFPFSGPVIDERGILKKELQFEPVASDEPLPGKDEPDSILPDLARRRESKYYRLEEKRRKAVSFCKKFAAFLFSHIGLISLVVAYSIMGGFLFRAIEGPHELQHRNEIRQFRDKTVLDLLDIAVLVQTDRLEKSNFTEKADKLLKSFQTQIYLATKERGWDGDDSTLVSLKQWSYASSLLYAITVMTTIGYGHVAPITKQGRLVTIGYAVLGIPLTLLCLTNLGDLMADGFRFLYGKICCGLCCLPFRRRPRRLPDPEKGESHVTTDEEEEIDKPKEVIHVPTSLCMFLIVGYIMAGALLFSRWEKWDYLTGSYFCFITLSTIGFGDIVPGMEIQSWSQQEKLVLCTLYLVIGLSVIAMCFTLVQEDVKNKCRWLGQKIGIIEKADP